MNYNGKLFQVVNNTSNGETTSDTIFEYKQQGTILTATYKGEKILQGHLIGLVDENGQIKMSYHQVNIKGELLTGVCTSTPEILSNGKIRLHENWQWTSGDRTAGNSILEELS